jgi:hypothetical protein
VHEGLLLWLTEQQNQFIAAQQQQQSSTNNTSSSSSSSVGSSSSKAKKQPKKLKKGCWFEGFNPADLPLPDAVALPHEPSPLAAAAREGIVIDAAAAAAGGITGPYLESSGGSKSPSTHHPFMSATPTKTKTATATTVTTATGSSSDDNSSAAAARGGILTNTSPSDHDTAAATSATTAAGTVATAGADNGSTVAHNAQEDAVARAATAVHSGSLELGDTDATGDSYSSAAAAGASNSNGTAAAAAAAAGGSSGDAVEFDASKLIAHLKSLPFYKVNKSTFKSQNAYFSLCYDGTMQLASLHFTDSVFT